MSEEPFAILATSRSAEPEHGRPGLWALILVVLVLIIAAVYLLGPGSQALIPSPSPTGTPERTARVYTVSYKFGVFSPTNLRIHAGDTVRFSNDSPLPIRIVADMQAGQQIPAFDSVGPVQPGSYFSYTFADAGVFAYHNASNKNEAGDIIVR